MIGFTTVRIIGGSMAPALRNGEVYLAVRGARIRVGDAVVLRHPERPHLATVKRIVRRVGEDWWVEGDNLQASSDSRDFGPVPHHAIDARILMRLRPLRRT